MKESLWGYYLVLLGILVSTVMIMVSNMTTTNQQNYYLLKEVTNSAMIDAIDYGYYREYGSIKINTEKFVENFLRRFSEGISKTNTYKIDFYSIYENPPSVSIRVTSNTGDYNITGDSTNIDVVNSIDAILEANNVITYSKVLYSLPYGKCEASNYISSTEGTLGYGYCRLINRAELKIDTILSDKEIEDNIINKLQSGEVYDSSKLKISDVTYLAPMTSNDDLNNYKNMYSSTYNREKSLEDIPDAQSDDSYFTQYIDNVKLTLKKENNKFYLGYGLDFNCGNAKKLGTNGSTNIYYRIGTSINNMYYLSATESYFNSNYKNYYYRRPNESVTGTSWFSLADVKTKIEYDALSSSEKEKYIKFERVPWYGNCLIGIKYRVNFYYDDAS